MGYIEETLVKGETVIYKTKLHWFPVFFWPAFFLLLSILWLKLSIIYGNFTDFEAGVLFLLIALIWCLGSFVNYLTSEVGVTNKRFLAKVGWLKRRSVDILLTKVEAIQVEQGILGRIVGYGTVVVTGTGGTKSVLKNITHPFELRKIVQEQSETAQEPR
jgi:uncharacterized membrane protein YdbT with pleckstrin-like domain